MWSLVAAVLAILLSAIYVLKRMLHSKMYRARAPTGVDMTKQSIEIEPGVYKSGLLAGKTEATLDTAWPEVKTLYDAFLRGLEVSNNGPCLGHRPGPNLPYHYISYTDTLQHARNFGSALVGQLGLKPGNTTHVGVYAKNSPEWFICALGSMQQSIVVVPLYDTLGPEAATFAVQQTEISVIVVDSAEKAHSLLAKKSDMPTLEHVVIIDVDKLPTEFSNNTSGVHAYMEVLREGKLNPKKMLLPKPDDTYIICYTSGTTGLPKGVICTHRMIVANISGLYTLCHSFHPDLFGTREALISYLPLSHMMEQLCHFFALAVGARIGYYRGNILNLLDDLKACKPTLLPIVPRLLNRFYDAIQQKLQSSGPISRALYKYAYEKKLSLLKQGIAGNQTIWDKLVFGKLQAQLGGCVKLMCTGSAPVSSEVFETARVAFGAVCLEAYGQTECTAAATFSWPGDYTTGHVGAPAVCATMKLADVPDLEYYAAQGKGEICVKGPTVTKGYFKDPEKTAELIDEDGFLHTGDVGQLMPNGKFRIIDRKKHIFKLAQGEYVAPEKIENIYVRAPVVQQVFVDGNSLERFLVAVVVPDPAILKQWYKANIKDNGVTINQMVNQKEVRDYILAELQKIGKENKLNSMEQVKAVHVTADAFSIENGLLTPTMKSKRPQLRKHYAEIIARLYVEAKASGA